MKIRRIIYRILFLYLLVFGIFITSCMKDDFRPITEFNTNSRGVFIVCEGNFMYGNASLSYYSPLEKKVENTVFIRANGIPLGDVAQSLTIYDKTAWIIVNNSGKVYAIDIDNFKIKGKITDLVSPRYMRFINPQKAYITDLYAKNIYVVNPQDYSLTKTINIDDGSGKYYNHSSEQIVVFENKLFINTWSYDNKILVIDTNSDEVIDSIEVFKQPRKIVADKEKNLWVLSDGGSDYSDYKGDAGITKINMQTHKIEQSFVLPSKDNITDMQINKTGDTIFYVNGNIFRFPINATSLPQKEWINVGHKTIYGIGQDPYNYDFYISDAVDYMQSGVIYRYNSNLHCVDSFAVGIIPNSFVFK